MKTMMALLFFISSMAHAVDSADTLSSTDSDYCKVPYIDKFDGSSGTYRGQCDNGKPHGSGTITFYNGDKLVGNFNSGILEGSGTYTSVEGNVYEGEWVKGKRHGRGTFTWAQGSTYVGEWLDDKRHGQGVFTWANGNRFKGEFRDNKRYNGKYYTSNGGVYVCRMGQCK